MAVTGKDLLRYATLAGALALLAGCSGVETEASYPRSMPGGTGGTYETQRQTIFGDGGLNIFDTEKNRDGTGGASPIGVNSFLWRASLDTISFMPLASADPFGGVLITDWYSAPETPGERMKLTVYILDRQLRADGIRVAAFKQRRDETGTWVDQPVEPAVATRIEDAILTRARQLRVSSSAS